VKQSDKLSARHERRISELSISARHERSNTDFDLKQVHSRTGQNCLTTELLTMRTIQETQQSDGESPQKKTWKNPTFVDV